MASTLNPNWGPNNVFLLYKNQVQVLPPLPSGSQTAPLFFELLIVNLESLKREAKYIPLVNEEINLFKSCPGASHRTAAQGWGVQGVVTPVHRQGGGSTALVAPTCADALNTSPGPGAHLLGAKCPALYRSSVFWAKKQARPGPGSLHLPGTKWKRTRLALAAAGRPGRLVTDPLPPVPEVSTSHSGLFIKIVVKNQESLRLAGTG